MIERDWLCLDLLKTRGWESRDRDDDVLDAPVRFLAWARRQDLLSPPEARRLRAAVGDDADWASGALAGAKELRELLHRVFGRVADEEVPDESDLRALEDYLAASGQSLTLGADAEGGIAWRWTDDDVSLADAPSEDLGDALADRIIGAVARSAADLLTCGELERVKVCAADDCGWFFVDVSRNRSRRWCDMAGCGNRDKARRYRARHG
ncbi:MAG: CGNR zinc finger domain-containing protein [Gemmatimonadota bacterium]